MNHYEAVTNVLSDPNQVRVTASLDPQTRALRWVIESVDSATGSIPDDPLAGFLPPNDSQGRGEGYVRFSARLAASVPAEAVVQNQATIVFDVNAALATNIVTNTIDHTPPTSTVSLLPAISPPAFAVSWSGNDFDASGNDFYDVYVSTDGGSFIPWQMGITGVLATFSGTVGHTYTFYSVATDQVGNRQPTPAGAQASTTTRAFIYLPLVLRQ